MAGRRPVPDKLKDLTGSHNPRNKRSPRFRSVDGVPRLKAIDVNLYACEYWDETLPDMIANGLISRASLRHFGMMCLAYAACMEAQDDIVQRGRVLNEPITNRAGDLVGNREYPNPAIAQAQRARLEFLRYGIEFGITPAAATRVQADPPGDVEKPASFGDFMGGDDESVTRTGGTAN